MWKGTTVRNMNPYSRDTLDTIRAAWEVKKKLWTGRTILLPEENEALKKVEGLDLVGILLDRAFLEGEILRQCQFRLKHIADATQCIGLDVCHVDGNCIHCLAKSDFKIEMGKATGLDQ